MRDTEGVTTRPWCQTCERARAKRREAADSVSFTTLLAACNKGMVWGQERLPREIGGEGREEGERARERGGEVMALRAPKIKSK